MVSYKGRQLHGWRAAFAIVVTLLALYLFFVAFLAMLITVAGIVLLVSIPAVIHWLIYGKWPYWFEVG